MPHSCRDAAGRKVAVAFAGIGGQRLDLGQHLAALGGQRPGLVGFAQRGERLGISLLFRVVAASVTAVVADVERLVAVGNRSGRTGQVLVGVVDARGEFGTGGQLGRGGLRSGAGRGQRIPLLSSR